MMRVISVSAGMLHIYSCFVTNLTPRIKLFFNAMFDFDDLVVGLTVVIVSRHE